MPFNGSGTYAAPASSWNPGVDGSPATTADFNALLTDLETGLSNAVTRDGQSPATANIPMGSNRITGLAYGTAITDAANVAQTLSPNPRNIGLAFAVASNAMTISLKGADGNDPSATNPVVIPFRSATAATGTHSVVNVAAALTVTISSGSTVGSTSAVPQDIYVYALNNAGTVELAFSGADIGDSVIASSTAEGGAGAADSATVLYSTTARTNVSVTKIGRFRHSQTTAGTWTSVPTASYVGLDVNRRTGRELLFDSGNFSGVTSYDIPNVIGTLYDVYEIEFINILPATDAVELWARVSTDNGSTYLTGTGYAHARNAGLSGGTSGASGSSADSKWIFSAGLKNTLGHLLTMTLRAQGGASGLRASMVSKMFAYLGADVAIVDGAGWIDQQNINAIRFMMSSGNISGRIRMYGVAQ